MSATIQLKRWRTACTIVLNLEKILLKGCGDEIESPDLPSSAAKMYPQSVRHCEASHTSLSQNAFPLTATEYPTPTRRETIVDLKHIAIKYIPLNIDQKFARRLCVLRLGERSNPDRRETSTIPRNRLSSTTE